MEELKLGDVVKLNSGGPHMTIDMFGKYDGVQKAKCVWFDGPKQDSALIALTSLSKANKD